jgi:hypothetical protein
MGGDGGTKAQQLRLIVDIASGLRFQERRGRAGAKMMRMLALATAQGLGRIVNQQ